MAIYRRLPSCGAFLKLDRTICLSWNNSTHFGFVFTENLSALYNLFTFENGIDILEFLKPRKALNTHTYYAPLFQNYHNIFFAFMSYYI